MLPSFLAIFSLLIPPEAMACSLTTDGIGIGARDRVGDGADGSNAGACDEGDGTTTEAGNGVDDIGVRTGDVGGHEINRGDEHEKGGRRRREGNTGLAARAGCTIDPDTVTCGWTRSRSRYPSGPFFLKEARERGWVLIAELRYFRSTRRKRSAERERELEFPSCVEALVGAAVEAGVDRAAATEDAAAGVGDAILGGEGLGWGVRAIGFH